MFAGVNRWRERGQSTAEALLISVVLITLIFGGLEVARAVAVKQAMDRGAYESARYLAVNPDPIQAEDLARDIVGRAILGADRTKMVFTTTWYPGIDYGDRFCVTILYDIDLDLPLVATSIKELSATHCTVSEVYP